MGHAILVGLENALFVANKIIEKDFQLDGREFCQFFKKDLSDILINIKNLEENISGRIGLSVSIKNNKKNKGSNFRLS